MLNKKQLTGFIIGYFVLRVFAYFFGPDTPLQVASIVNQIITTLIFVGTIYLIFKQDWRGWAIIAGEIILGGAGGYLALGGIALRTWLLFGSLIIFTFQIIRDRFIQQELYFLIRQMAAPILLLLMIAEFGAINGYLNGHDIKLIFADGLPYVFLLYTFPLLHFWTNKPFRSTLFNLFVAGIIGNVTFAFFTFSGFSSGIFTLQDNFYHWFRDVAGGKITDLTQNFYRVVLNEHLLLSPLLVYFIGRQTAPQTDRGPDSRKIPAAPHKNIFVVLAILLLAVLSLSLTRAYMLGIAGGLLLLVRRDNWQRLLMYGAGVIVTFVVIFSSTHLFASRGHSAGWELLGLRTQAISAPQLDDSGLSRLLILPAIWEKIKYTPFFGTGLGDTVTIYSPILKKTITTPHFDWGYFEIAAELGLLGLVAWLYFIGYLIFNIFKNKVGDARRIFLATLFCFLIINITSPALTHVIGMVWLIIIISPIGWYFSHSTGGIVVNKQNEIAMVSNLKSHTWTFPKGNVEPNEDVSVAAKREIYEETGIAPENLQITKFLGDYERLTYIPPYNLYIHKQISFFLARGTGQLCPLDPENPEARWVKKEEVVKLLNHPKDRAFFIKIADQV